MTTYSDRAHIYELLYSYKNYEDEARVIRELLVAEGYSDGRLLDVGCGPADHLAYLQGHYDISGVDLSEQFITRARERLPDARFEVADMADFSLQETFDIIVSLFSAIGYVKTPERLAMTIRCLANHLAPDGIVLIEPWFEPEEWKVGYTDLMTYKSEDLKIARVTHSSRDRNISIFEARYVMADANGFEEWSEVDELGLFTHEEQIKLLEENGFSARFEPLEGLADRGLIIAKKR